MNPSTADDYCLKGEEHYRRSNREGNDSAVACFTKALELDADYARAHAGLSLAYSQRATTLGLERRWLDDAVAAAERAITIDPNLTEAYRALWVALYPRQYLGRMRLAAQKMIELNPDDVSALRHMGWLLWFTGHADEALPYLKTTMARDPAFRWAYFWLGNACLSLGLYDQAEEMYGKAVKVRPNLSSGHTGLICTYLSQGKREQAFQQNAQFRRSPDDDRYFLKAADVELLLGNVADARVFAGRAVDGPDARYMPRGVCASTILGCVLWNDDRAEARKRLDQSTRLDRKRLDEGDESFMPCYDLAAVSAILGDTSEAYRWLDTAISAGWRTYRLAMLDPLLKNLHDHGPFQSMMAEVETKVVEARQRVTTAFS